VPLDIYSRYVPGFLVAPTETGELAKEFIAATIAAAGVAPRVVHADRDTSMTSKPVALLLADLGVVRSHSRPKVSNDNPYSEAAFKTLKYCPAFPARRVDPRRPRLLRPALRLTTTTTSTATAASGYTPPRPRTSAPPPRSAPTELTPSPPPTNATPTGSGVLHSRHGCPPRSGSTDRR
jgi:hypothetical protein